jgi:hypothetical protein
MFFFGSQLFEVSSQNAYMPIAAFPALIAFPKKCKCKDRTARPICGWKIGEPKIQFVLVRHLRLVSPRPIVR